MQKLAPKAWAKYRDYVINLKKKNGTYDEDLEAYKKDYGNISETELQDEMACDYTDQLFKNEKDLLNFINHSKSLATKVKDIWFWVLDKLNIPYKEDARSLWEKCYKEATKEARKGESSANSGVRYKRTIDNDDIDGTINISKRNYKVNWTVEEDILSRKELGEFYRSLGKLEEGKWYPQTLEGEFIFETDDKLIYTDGNYVNPFITKVIIFDGLTSEEIEYGKEVIWNGEIEGQSCEECIEIAQIMLGNGTISTRNYFDSKTYWRSPDNKGKRGDSSKNISKDEIRNSGHSHILSGGQKGDEGTRYKYPRDYTDVSPENSNENNEKKASYGGADYDYSRTTRKVYNDRAWAYTLLNNEDLALLKEKYQEYFIDKIGRENGYIEVNNKLIFLSGSYNNPEITEVVVINAEDSTTFDVYKDLYEGGILYAYTEADRWSKQTIEQGQETNDEIELVKRYDAEIYACSNEKSFRARENATLPDEFKSFGYTGSFTIRDGIYRKNEEGISRNSEIKNLGRSRISSAAEATRENREATREYERTHVAEFVEKYGAIPKGEKPYRDVQVPKKTDKDKKVSQTVRTILEAKATPDEAIPSIEKMVEDGVFSYDVYTDKQAIKESEDYLEEYGWVESLNDWIKDVEKGIVTKQHTAMGWALYNNAVNISTTSTSETERATAIKTSLDILDAMVRHQRNAAQALQATKILKKLSPETQLYGVQKSVSAFQKELVDKYGDKAPNLKIDEELAERFLTAETEDERLAV